MRSSGERVVAACCAMFIAHHVLRISYTQPDGLPVGLEYRSGLMAIVGGRDLVHKGHTRLMGRAGRGS